jgi:metal-responsive CopG/Arc/MetJ family transcriptional regulator
MSLKRFGVSLEEDLLTELDQLVEKDNFPNRSRAIAYLVQKNIIQEKWDNDELVAGARVVAFKLKKLESKYKGLKGIKNVQLVMSGTDGLGDGRLGDLRYGTLGSH